MLVTKVESVTKTKYRVELDQQFAFVLYKGELAKFGIREMEEIPEEQYEKIRTEVILKRAKLRAMHLLTDMARTESGLREKLKQGMYPEDLIDAAIDYVKSFGYLDDNRYAEQFVESRKGSKSKQEIRALLLQKGIRKEKIDRALEKCWQEEDSAEAIRALIRKKRVDLSQASEQEIQRLYAFFGRKGFRFEDVRQVIQNYNEDA